MKKLKNLFIFLLSGILLITLFSCRNKSIAGPINIVYNYQTYQLDWDEINKASKYIIHLNGELYISETNNFSFKGFEKGFYKVKIKGVIGNKETAYSNTITFNVSEYVNLRVYSNGEYVYWDDVLDLKYEIEYFDNLSIKTIETFENRYLIPNELKKDVLKVTIRGYLGDTLRSYETIFLDYNIVRVSQNETYSLKIKDVEEVYINGKLEKGVNISDEEIRLSSRIMSNYSGEIYLSIIGEENVLKRILILKESFELITFYIQPYVGKEVRYKFRFNNFEIEKIENLVRDVDYYIESFNTLVIIESFIKNYQVNNPEDVKIRLKVTLKKGDIVESLYLEIDLI